MTQAIADEVASSDEVGGSRTDVSVAFTDLEGFVAFTAAEGDDAAGRLLLDHRRHAERLARRRGGRVVKRLGDGLLLVFDRPTMRRFKGIDELVPVSATSRTSCDWSPTDPR